MKVFHVLAVIGGSILQWYDFALFGTLAPVLATHFFPAANHMTALLYTFAVFAVSFLLAPVGSIFFGHIGDRFGRKRALTLTVLLMTIPTALIALLPSYQAMGLWATGLLITFRLMQGFVASPEFSGAAVFLVESAPPHRKAFYGSMISMGYTLGLILGGVVTATALSWFPQVTWMWRVPFAVSIVGAVVVLMLRRYVPESAVFQRRHVVGLPLWHALTTNRRACVLALGSAWLQGVIAYGCYVWMVTYLHVFVKVALPLVLLAISLGLIVNAITECWFGLLADEIGLRRCAVWGLILFAIAIGPIFSLLQSGQMSALLLAMGLIGLLIAFAMASLNALVVMQFRPQHRMSGFGVLFNIGIALFGGTTPLVLTGLLHFSHHLFLCVSYLLLALIVGLITILLLKPVT